MRRIPLLIPVLLVALVAAGCSGARRQDPLLKLSAAEALAKGKDLMERKKYGDARKYLQHAFEVEPNSAAGREGLLLAGDALFLDGGTQNLIQAEAKYRDFQKRFPTSDKAAYVQFQIGKSLAARMERPDRDQSTSEKALEAFRDLVRLYPTSDYATQSKAEIARVQDNLAEHDYLVGSFYYRYGLPGAAAMRMQRLLDTYPDYSHKDKVLYLLGRAYERQEKSEESRAAFDRLRKEFPESPYLEDLPGNKT
jgi:outer membrane protein assembly factor BamD